MKSNWSEEIIKALKRFLNGKVKWPSLDNENPKTWRCKLFGCRSEELPLVWQESGEKHGIKGFSFATATKTLISYTFKGCMWCGNFRKLFGDEDDCWPKWKCGCEICNP
jgi:hypothetical protein